MPLIFCLNDWNHREEHSWFVGIRLHRAPGWRYNICAYYRWDDRSSVVTPDEEVFYLVAFLRSALSDSDDPTQSLEYLSQQNQKILEFCDEVGIEMKQYLPHHPSRTEWARHFGPKWARFVRRKAQFDPKFILGTGQGIFQPSSSPLSLLFPSWGPHGSHQ